MHHDFIHGHIMKKIESNFFIVLALLIAKTKAITIAIVIYIYTYNYILSL